MRLWGLKNCDGCRKAIKDLTAAGREVMLVDVRADGVEPADLERFFTAFGEALVNRRSTTWRGLSDSDRAMDRVELMAAYPTLMKRPVVEADGQLTLGWGADARAVWNL